MQNESRVAVLRKRYEDIRALSDRASKLVDEVSGSYTQKLDAVVKDVEGMLDAGNISDKALHKLVMRLPVLIYRAVEILDVSAIESSIAKAAQKSVYATYYLESSGTIPEREAFASLKSAEEGVIVDLARHVYNRVKGKIEAAQALQDGVKKLMGSRDTEKQTFGRDRG